MKLFNDLDRFDAFVSLFMLLLSAYPACHYFTKINPVIFVVYLFLIGMSVVKLRTKSFTPFPVQLTPYVLIGINVMFWTMGK